MLQLCIRHSTQVRIGGWGGGLLGEIVEEGFCVGSTVLLTWHFFVEELGPFKVVFFGGLFAEDVDERFARLDTDDIQHTAFRLHE